MNEKDQEGLRALIVEIEARRERAALELASLAYTLEKLRAFLDNHLVATS